MSAQQSISGTTALARVYWMAMGPVILAFLTLAIVNRGSGWMTSLDIGYFAVLLGIVFARWLEFKGGDAQTAYGEPATSTHLRKFIGLTLVVGSSVWVLANLVGNHLLKN